MPGGRAESPVQISCTCVQAHPNVSTTFSHMQSMMHALPLASITDIPSHITHAPLLRVSMRHLTGDTQKQHGFSRSQKE